MRCATRCWSCSTTSVPTTCRKGCRPSWKNASRSSRATDSRSYKVSIMENIYIVGVGMTTFGRHLDKTIKQLTAWAVEDALKDSGCDRKWIQAAFFGNTTQGHFEGQHMIRGQLALLPLGIDGIPIYNLEAACASSSHAFNLAVTQLRAGAADVVLAVGAEKMYSHDKAKMFSAFESAWDLETPEQNVALLADMGKDIIPPPGSQS